MEIRLIIFSEKAVRKQTQMWSNYQQAAERQIQGGPYQDLLNQKLGGGGRAQQSGLKSPPGDSDPLKFKSHCKRIEVFLFPSFG